MEEIKKKTTLISIENAKVLVGLVNEYRDVIFCDPTNYTEEQKKEIEQKFTEMRLKLIKELALSGVSGDYSTYCFDIVEGMLQGFKNSTSAFLGEQKAEILSRAIGFTAEVMNPDTQTIENKLRHEYAPIEVVMKKLEELRGADVEGKEYRY